MKCTKDIRRTLLMSSAADSVEPIVAETNEVDALKQQLLTLQKAAELDKQVVEQAQQFLKEENDKSVRRMQQMKDPIATSLDALTGNAVSTDDQVREAANSFREYMEKCTSAESMGANGFNRAHEQQMTLVHCFSSHAVENEKLRKAAAADAECIKKMGMEIDALKGENKRLKDEEMSAAADESAKSQRLSLFSRTEARECAPRKQTAQTGNDLFEWVKSYSSEANTQFMPNTLSNSTLLCGKMDGAPPSSSSSAPAV